MNQIKKILENEKRLLWLTFLAAFGVRLVYALVYYYKFGTTQFVDDWDYISYAKEIIRQGPLVLDIDRIYSNGHEVGIGWPLIISPIIGLFDDNYIPVFILNAIFSALHVLVLYKIAKFIFSHRVALVTIVISIFYIRFIKFVPFVLKENIIHLGFSTTVYLFLKSMNSYKIKDVVLLAVVFLLFIHIDERYAIFGPVFVGIYLVYGIRNFKTSVRNSALLTAVVVIGVIPWTLRNYKVYKRPIVLAFQTSEFTDFLFDNKTEFYNGKSQIQKSPYSRKHLSVYEKMVEEIVAGESVNKYKPEYKYVDDLVNCVTNDIVPVKYSPIKGKFMEAAEFYRICRFKAGFTGNGYRFFPRWRLLNNIIYLFSFGIPFGIMILFILGSNFRFNSYIQVLFILMIVYSMLHILVIHGIIRYRVPIDGFIFILASAGMVRFFDKSRLLRVF